MVKYNYDGGLSCYFLFLYDSSSKQEEIRKFREALSVGDKVVTAGGIYGKIKEIKDNIIVLEIADNVRIRIDKSSIYATAADSTTTNQA